MDQLAHTTEAPPAEAAIPADAQEALKLHGRWLRAVAVARLHGSEGADDVMQDVALSAVRGWHTLRDAANARPWLYRLTVRAALMHRRTLGRARRRVQEAADKLTAAPEVHAAPSPLDILLDRERAAHLRQRLKTMPARDVEMLMLKHVENLTYHEIADRLGVTVNVVQMRLFRLRQKLRQAVTQDLSEEKP